MTATARRRLLPRVRPRAMLRRLGLRGLGVLLAVAAVLVGAFFWVRQSSLVAVQDVTVTGVSGPDASAIRSTLVRTAEGMTTMDLDRRRLEAAVAPYPYVRSLRLSAHFPHALDIAVSERLPVAVIQAGGRRITVSSDGLLMRGTTPRSALPTIDSATTPNGASVGGPVRKDVAVLAAAPYPLLAKIASATELRGHGLAVTLRDGPVIYFGDAGRLATKWKAAIAVLASTTSNGADYIDVTDPARPAAGTGSDG